MLVATHTRQDDEVLLTTLESVHRGNLDLLVVLLPECAALLHALHDEAALTLVRRDDTNVLGLDTGLEEAGDNLLDVLGFSPVQETGTRGRNFLRAKVGPEHHRVVNHGPWEVHVSTQALVHGNTILQRAFVEHVAGELGETRVHTVLHLQANGSTAKNDQTLKQRLV